MLEAERVLAAWQDHFAARPALAGALALSGRAWHEREVESTFTTLVTRRTSLPNGVLQRSKLWHLDQLVAADPNKSDYRADRGTVLANLGHWSEALADLNLAGRVAR